VCTQYIAHIMLKDSENSTHQTRRTHRTYTPAFKAQLVAACHTPGASIAALAHQHGMNANVLHRWLNEHHRTGRHQLVDAAKHITPVAPSHSPAFIALTLPPANPVPRDQEVKLELRKGALSMVVTWPLSATADLARWTAAVLQ
jgi:transposase-like protein